MNKYRVIELSQGFVAVIDAEDYRRVNRHSWHVHRSKGTKKKPGEPYARASIKGKKVYLHRFVMQDALDFAIQEGCTEREDLWHVDHRNHQTLDCRKENLEVVFHVENNLRRRNVNAASTIPSRVRLDAADHIPGTQ